MATKFAAFGATLQYKPDASWLVCAGVRDISGPGFTGDTIDVTTHDSPDGFREHLKTLIDAGEVTFDLVWDPEDALGQAYLLTEMQARTSQSYRLQFASTNEETWEIVAYVTGFDVSNPLEGEISASITMKITGKPNLAPT